MATTSNSQDPPPIDLSSTGVGVLSPPPNDTGIVIAGDVLLLQLGLSVTRQVMVVAICTNEPVGVSRHITNAGDGTGGSSSGQSPSPWGPPSPARPASTDRNGPPSSWWRSWPVGRDPLFSFGKAIGFKIS